MVPYSRRASREHGAAPRRNRVLWRRRVVLVLLGVLLAGCTTPADSPPERRQPGTVREALGDPRTVDPCTLTDATELGRFGQVSDAPTVSLDYCLQHVRTPDGSRIQLATGELDTTRPAQRSGDPITRHGTWRVVREAPLPGHCARQIMVTDRVSMRVSADLLDGEPGSGLCSVAEAGARATIARLDQHQVGHRSFPPHSLALVDPCTVLDTGVVRQVPGLEGANAAGGPGRHRCQWGRKQAGAPRVRLTHTAGAPPKMLHGTSVTEDIAGRRTVLSVVGGNPRTPLCSAETAHIPFGRRDSGQREVAMLVIALPGANGIEACEFARGLAERAWPRLPAAANG